MLWDALGLDMTRHRTVALVGAGGKTTLMYALALEVFMSGVKVVLTTTTHILPHPLLPLAERVSELDSALREYGAVVYAARRGEKLSPPEDFTAKPLPELSENCVVLIEADGSKGLPLKAPDAHEPVIPASVSAVICVSGLRAVGGRICEVCHRPELVCGILGKDSNSRISPGDIAALMSSPLGGLKNVAAGMAYRCALNQGDGGRGASGLEARKALEARGIIAAVTSFSPEERGGLNWKRTLR